MPMDTDWNNTTYNFSALTCLLRSPDTGKRLHAVEALGRLGDSRAVLPLLLLLKNPDVELRTAVMQAFCRLGAQAVPGLCAQVQKHGWNAEVRADATAALGIIGLTEACPVLREALCDPEPLVRSSACGAIGRLQPPDVVPALIECLSDTNGPVRQKAAHTLGHIGDTQAVPALIHVLRSGDEWDRSAVTQALSLLTARHPVAELQAALPILHRLSNQRPNDPKILGYRKLAAQIESATDRIKDLPLPSAASADSLPRPASPPFSAVDTLPIPSAVGTIKTLNRHRFWRFWQRS
jgi:HEAT repeat protein